MKSEARNDPTLPTTVDAKGIMDTISIVAITFVLTTDNSWIQWITL